MQHRADYHAIENYDATDLQESCVVVTEGNDIKMIDLSFYVGILKKFCHDTMFCVLLVGSYFPVFV